LNKGSQLQNWFVGYEQTVRVKDIQPAKENALDGSTKLGVLEQKTKAIYSSVA
jgi:hypothetical protein